MIKADTDAGRWEYTTYAPKGETCPSCLEPIKSLEVCRRGMLARRDSSRVVAYWHSDCAQKEMAR
ncbi:hypothetical protein ACWD5R_04270 [Streptomyces sp. NPDC002514]|uniref:hypothetical protein n=1 Tax=unclassified Streptomyces TaxID=2593676 RepID=UPI0036B9007A